MNQSIVVFKDAFKLLRESVLKTFGNDALLFPNAYNAPSNHPGMSLLNKGLVQLAHLDALTEGDLWQYRQLSIRSDFLLRLSSAQPGGIAPIGGYSLPEQIIPILKAGVAAEINATAISGSNNSTLTLLSRNLANEFSLWSTNLLSEQAQAHSAETILEAVRIVSIINGLIRLDSMPILELGKANTTFQSVVKAECLAARMCVDEYQHLKLAVGAFICSKEQSGSVKVIIDLIEEIRVLVTNRSMSLQALLVQDR